MKHLAIILASLLIAGCSTTQQAKLNNAVTIAKPIVDVALKAAAAHYGVTPAETEAGIAAFDSLWGAAAQAQAGQPPAAGASSPDIGTAIQGAIPAGMTSAQQAAVLSLAAQLVKRP